MNHPDPGFDVALSPEECEELLGRTQPVIESVQAQPRRILVTGAGGSIGRPLVMTLLERGHAVVALDQSERGLFQLMQMAGEHHGLSQLQLLVRHLDGRGLGEDLLRSLEVDTIIHAAAHKHVGLMQRDETECRANNVDATLALYRAAGKAGLARFVFISTDKAVNPTSVMGRTKLEAERALTEQAAVEGLSLVTVRLPNVLGSDGSVVQIFRRQILLEQPLTLSHEDAHRLFISSDHACTLIQAAMESGHEGCLVPHEVARLRIRDLADRCNDLWGRSDSFAVELIGLGEGERLEESLVGADERAEAIAPRGLLLVHPSDPPSHAH